MEIEETTPTVAEALLVLGEGEALRVALGDAAEEVTEDTTEEATEEPAAMITGVAEEATEATTGEIVAVAVEVAEETAAGVTAAVVVGVITKDETTETSPAERAELIEEAVAAIDALANALYGVTPGKNVVGIVGIGIDEAVPNALVKSAAIVAAE